MTWDTPWRKARGRSDTAACERVRVRGRVRDRGRVRGRGRVRARVRGRVRVRVGVGTSSR